MNWFRQNPLFGAILIALALALIASIAFLYGANSRWSDASAQFQTDANELMRLQRLTPFPTGENVRKMKAHAEDYSSALAKLKDELKLHVIPAPPQLAPSDFQSRLRIAISAATDRARANNVKLPTRFFLGFDEFASRLPQTADAPLLGQELAQIELLTNIIFDAKVDAVTAFRRMPKSEASASPTPASATARANNPAAPQLIARNVVEATFVSSPGAARRVLNQITVAEKQFYITRLLQVRNEKDKGPPREAGESAAAPPAVGGASSSGAALKFIVGNEHVETSARIELVRFTY